MKEDIISPHISTRVFYAIDQLTEAGQLTGLQEFCKRYGISTRLAYFQRQDPERRIIRLSWLTYLVRDYNISAHWLLTGEGPMTREVTAEAQKRAKNVQEIHRLLDSLL